MKQILCFSILFLAFRQDLEAQLQPAYETTLYFEDAVGNKDTIVIAYDTEATSQIDPEFGEVGLSTPFDSVFEVRAGNVFEWNVPLTKRLVTYMSNPIPGLDYCNGYTYPSIFIHALHQPVKVSWDRTFFSGSECRAGAAIINHVQDEVAGPIGVDEILPVFHCMAEDSSGIFDLTEETLLEEYGSFLLHKDYPVEGQGIKTIYGLRMIIELEYGYTPCYWVSSVENTDWIEPSRSLELFPNPASHLVNWSLPPNVQVQSWELLTLYGRRLFSGKKRSDNALDVSAYPAGIYHLRLLGSDGYYYSGKLVKI